MTNSRTITDVIISAEMYEQQQWAAAYEWDWDDITEKVLESVAEVENGAECRCFYEAAKEMRERLIKSFDGDV
jgi:hypothetical protein